MENLAYTDDETQKQRIETIDGVIVMMSPRPRPEHTVISGRIFAEFDRYLRKKPKALSAKPIPALSVGSRRCG